MDRDKIIKMVVLLAAIVVIAGGLSKVMHRNSMSLAEYAKLNNLRNLPAMTRRILLRVLPAMARRIHLLLATIRRVPLLLDLPTTAKWVPLPQGLPATIMRVPLPRVLPATARPTLLSPRPRMAFSPPKRRKAIILLRN